MHKTTVVSVKFIGNPRKECTIISSDLKGIVYVTSFDDGMFLFTAHKKLLMEKRLGPSYSIAPLQIRPVVNFDKFLVNMQSPEEAEAEKKRLIEVYNQQICAFGTLDEIYVAVIKPKAIPMMSCRRPPYINPGTVPYLDWGNALTPTYRDTSYPTLALAWGRVV